MKSFLCLLAAVVASAACAQIEKLPSEPYLSISEQSAWLVNFTRVKSDLNLSPVEQSAADKAFERLASEQKDLFAHDAGNEKQAEILEHQLAKSVLQGLSAEHRSRLRQLALQVAGPIALEDSDVATQVSLTSAQRSQIKAIYEAADDREADFEAGLAKKLQGVPDKQRMTVYKRTAPQRETLAKQRKSDDQKVLDLLTSAQRDQWSAMRGKPLG